jgi:putative transposase
VVIDAHSKRVLGWAFSPSLEIGFVIAALLMAIRHRGGRCAPGLLLHSDRGVQYSSERFRAQLAAHGITASMSRRCNCYDNARAEAFFSTLKIELAYRYDFEDHDQARRAVFEWIEAFYNLRRRHSSIGYLSPIDFENQKN